MRGADGVGIESGVERARVQTALDVLGDKIVKQSDPNALRLAFQAYYNYQAANPEKVKKPYLYFVDYGLDSRTPRGYVFDMKTLKVGDGPFTVAHGRGSAAPSSGVPTRFSNRQGSNATSLGLYLAQETYAFRGKSGGKAYTSPGLRLTGVSGKYNSAARARGVSGTRRSVRNGGSRGSERRLLGRGASQGTEAYPADCQRRHGVPVFAAGSNLDGGGPVGRAGYSQHVEGVDTPPLSLRTARSGRLLFPNPNRHGV